jgi:hypothetical protein
MKRALFSCLWMTAVVACSGSDNSGGPGASDAATGGNGQGTGGGSSGSSGAGGGGATGNGGSTTGTGGSTMTGGSSQTGGSSAGGASNGGSSTGGSSAGGAAGTGAGGMGAGGAVDMDANVLERNKHANRDGTFVQPMLTAAAAAKMAKDTGFNATFMGNMWASPLYLDKGPGGKGVFFAVTTGNDVFALDETTGMTVWTKSIGTPAQANGVSCGNIHPNGIISTPVIDAAAGTIYVAGAVGNAMTIMSHQVHAFNVMDGTERPGWPVTIAGTSGMTTFTAPPQNQRSALSLVNGTLYVAYGGHVGDCGNYHGWVFGIDTKDPTKMGGWATLGKGEGIWAAGGMASDGNGVFALTGNSTAGATDHMASDSEEVVRITGLGTFTRSNANLYFPTSWRTMDSQDADLGANSPLYVTVPGSTPAGYVVALSKDGHLYLLDPANLGGMAGHKVDFPVSSGAMSIHTAPGWYTSSKGVHIVFATDSGAMCPAGGASGKVVMSVLLGPGSPVKPSVAWCAALTGPTPDLDDDRRHGEPHRVVLGGRQAHGRRRRHRESHRHEHGHVQRRAGVDLAHRSEGTARHRRRRTPVLLVSTLS